MVAGQTYPITVTMRNVGSTDWTCCSGGSPAGNINNSDGFKLGDPRDFNSPFAPDVRFGVPQTTATGQDAVFSFNITAPVAPGSYTAQWRMVNEFDIWFGEATGVTAVNVVAGSTPTPTPIQTPSPSPSSVDPTGWIESADCSNITGWAFDQDNTSASINVELYDGQPGSGGLLVGTFPANILRPSINTTYGITGNHGYDTTTPVSLKTGSNHNIYIYGVNGGTSGQNTLLNGSPVTLNCSAPPVPTPTPQSSGISVINSNIWWPGAGLVKIAFDTVNQVYLAVSGDSGWFFDKDGVPIGNPFKIALENIPNTAWPNVAFGGPATDPTFLVTYVVGDQVTNPKYGRLVRYQAGGSPLIGNRSKIVDVRDSWYTSEKAVLVWSGTKFIVSSPVNLTAGSIGQPYIHSFSMTGVVSAGVSLGDGVNFAVPRGLACATNGICLSVGYTINGAYGRRFNSNTMTLLGSLFYIIDNQSAGNIQDADVVYNSKINKFVTTWARGGAGWADFRIVNLDGSMGPLDLTKSFGPTAGDVKLAYNSGTETTLLLSKLDSSASLYAVELGDNGYPIDPNKKIFLGAWDGIIPGYYPGLAADPVNARWLAMWAWIAGGAGYKGALISGSTSNLVPTPPTVFTTKDLGVGTFPDPVFFNGRVWVAVQQGPPGDYGKLNLYNFATNLTDQRVTQIPFSGVGRAFQRLGVFNNILWMIFRDGENSACAVDPTTCIPERIKLWRSDTGAIEDLGLVVGSGNRPVAIGNGYIAWQNKQDGFLKVFRRPIGGGTPVVLRSGLPTGITRILPSGNVVMYDTDLTAVPWGVSASFAGPLTVATDAYNLPPTIIPGNDNGIVGRFNNDPATQFNIWATERAHDPRAATDSQGYYVVATWNPTVRIAVFTSLGQTVDQIICDPLPTDTEALLECSFNNLLYGTPQTFAPGQDPSNPLELPAAGTWGFDSAYSSSNDRVLVVSTAVLDPIKDLRGIVGFIINPDTMAVEIGPMTIIGQGAQAPMVAYSPDQDRFLVAWEDSRSGDKFNRYVYARFVGVDGTLQGTDFEIRKQNTFLMDLDYDERNKKFVFMLSSGGENFIKTVDANGTVSQDIKVPQLISSEYEGQPTLAVNSNLNQYMVSMVGCINNNDPTLEDCKVGVYRYDVATNSWLGDPIILSQPNLGQNRFGRAEIVYSPIDSRALVVWQENAPANRAGQWGRVIYDNDTIGPEQAILNTNIFPYSSGYGGPHLNYNPWTNTIFNSTEDSDGGSILMEMTTDGSMLNIRQAIAPPDSSVQPYGTFYPNNVVTPQGALALGTQGYAAVVLTSTSSIFEDRSISPTSSQPGTVSPTTPDTTSLPRLINQIYIWSLGIGALLALLMVIFGGYMYMTAAGNAEQASKGVEILWGAIIGLALLFSSYLILRTINPDLVNFSIRSVENLGR
ncbi:MAG: hypothetical protein A3B10_00505 [Candidatus Doudnabacteria bacterium RIFCSPLOWO2_01_FULL_44_21]|uniref:Next to BRCA1 central domain-containing protein n=1 Tax=Candidatus Doudnabacteria bacterium RIFCSPLOWO2_01_FULL_44_21 TaxID=1817841 RepID=A0A1F5PYF9_9BACT|nr:MAG: hypothetical protein A3B10_00505 [Candidatus Doudnabacteria bacterium RIFCSPLOWO2_01_FULL_44_21]